MNLPPKKLIPFICYSKDNLTLVRDFSAYLKKESWIDPWFDEEDLLPGEKWQASVVEAVRQSHAVIILLSKEAVANEGFFHKELNLALDTANEKPEDTIFIIPVRLDDCTVPQRLLPYHYVDYFGDKDVKQRVMDNLLLALKLRAEELGILVK